ncbi:MAG: hypothetical protein FRX49_03987 [Trebouxia sp. A1-2]|nr:MAG: hypothetical protein FRX49_03987 [Trebouxia sp. A1-2]
MSCIARVASSGILKKKKCSFLWEPEKQEDEKMASKAGTNPLSLGVTPAVSPLMVASSAASPSPAVAAIRARAKKEKESECKLFSNNDGSLLRAAAWSYDHRPKPKRQGEVLNISLNILHTLNILKSGHPKLERPIHHTSPPKSSRQPELARRHLDNDSNSDLRLGPLKPASSSCVVSIHSCSVGTVGCICCGGAALFTIGRSRGTGVTAQDRYVFSHSRGSLCLGNICCRLLHDALHQWCFLN